MKSVLTIVAAGLLASSFAMSADAAAKTKDSRMAQRQAECQAQAKQKYSAVHFLKRRAFVKTCMRQKT
jgi:Ni/Co efflux regulator RcnB